eukprot:GHUV01001543.1.p1 GENE.GHUV01001543.1~~GHUV01001543.1.p1  ORF type:complete len:254 (+),score=39.42 GHUV01001543.1:1063-1824(+)
MCPHPLRSHTGPAGHVTDAEHHHHEHHVIDMGEGRRSVRLPSDSDVEITVAEDEPEKGAVEDDIASITSKKESRIRKYFDKWTGGIDKSLPFPSFQDVTISWLGAFIGILVVSITDHFLWRDHGFRLLVGSFGASAVLVYGVPESKLSQPRNLVGGQVISAIVGVCIRLALNEIQWLANALGMSLALVAMQLTGTTHPPGGATALIACSVADLPPWKGFQMVVAVLLGSLELMVVALIVSNFHRGRAYPTFWY